MSTKRQNGHKDTQNNYRQTQKNDKVTQNNYRHKTSTDGTI